jgi:hypothetical protein
MVMYSFFESYLYVYCCNNDGFELPAENSGWRFWSPKSAQVIPALYSKSLDVNVAYTRFSHIVVAIY